jgi:hypothetical protein
MPEEWLRRFYETGDNDYVLRLISHFSAGVDRFLRLCVTDRVVRRAMWEWMIRNLRESRRHPELHWDLDRGDVQGFFLAMGGHLAYRWLVWFEDPN